MGYTTNFEGYLTIDPPLAPEMVKFLDKFHEIRHMARNVDPKYGVEGELYVDGNDDWEPMKGKQDSDIIYYNTPPKTIPGLWLGWSVTADRLEWDGSEKFYNYVEWLEYLIKKFFKPNGHKLSGSIMWHGEDDSDIGKIIMAKNGYTVKIKVGRIVYD